MSAPMTDEITHTDWEVEYMDGRPLKRSRFCWNKTTDTMYMENQMFQGWYLMSREEAAKVETEERPCK